MNRVELVGRLTKDPELRVTQNNKQVCTFTVAVDRPHKPDAEETADFPQCVVWNKTADFLCRYGKKGSPVSVEGSIRTRNYDDKDGKRVYVTEIWVDRLDLLQNRETGSQGTSYDYGSRMGSSVSFKELKEEPVINPDPDELPF